MENLIIVGILIISGFYIYKKLFKSKGECATCSFSSVCGKDSCETTKIELQNKGG
jgi:hypothetical protein